MKWIKINSEKDLPQEGKYVIAKHNRGNWFDDEDQENVNTVIVKLKKGISEKEREDLRLKGDERALKYYGSDECSNNLVPYNWTEFGPDKFFGQNITHWAEIAPLED